MHLAQLSGYWLVRRTSIVVIDTELEVEKSRIVTKAWLTKNFVDAAFGLDILLNQPLCNYCRFG